MSTPGASIQWYYKTFYQTDETNASYEELANQSPIGANGVFFLPYMHGERTPIWDPNARGVFFGLHLNTSKEDMFRGILEGCAFGLRQIDDMIATKYNTNIERFQSIGGGAKNKVWAQIKANVLNKKIEIKSISETGIYGACLIASTAVCYFDSLKEAINEVKNETIDSIEPQSEAVPHYDELYEIYCELYPSLKHVFEKVSFMKQEQHEKVVKR
jgi:xylulokinase